MSTLFAHVMTAASDPPPTGAYSQELAQAVAAAAGVIAMLVVIYLVFKATYLVIRLFTRAAFLITLGIFVSVVVIGLLNR
jgi:hypothetical protein